MNRFSNLTGRASGFAEGVGDTVKALVPNAGHLIQAGMKMGVLKNGARVARLAVRRYPVVTAATLIGGGLLWYAARRRARRAEAGNDEGGEERDQQSQRGRRTLEGSARRVDARQGSEKETSGSTTRKRASSTGTRKRGTSGRGGSRSSETRSTTH